MPAGYWRSFDKLRMTTIWAAIFLVRALFQPQFCFVVVVPSGLPDVVVLYCRYLVDLCPSLGIGHYAAYW